MSGVLRSRSGQEQTQISVCWSEPRSHLMAVRRCIDLLANEPVPLICRGLGVAILNPDPLGGGVTIEYSQMVSL